MKSIKEESSTFVSNEFMWLCTCEFVSMEHADLKEKHWLCDNMVMVEVILYGFGRSITWYIQLEDNVIIFINDI